MKTETFHLPNGEAVLERLAGEAAGMYNYSGALTKEEETQVSSLPALKPNPQPVQPTYYRIYCGIGKCQEKQCKKLLRKTC